MQGAFIYKCWQWLPNVSGTWVDIACPLQIIWWGWRGAWLLFFHNSSFCIWKFPPYSGLCPFFLDSFVHLQGMNWAFGSLQLQAEALRDSFPPSDKSLSKLLGESPYLPKSVLKILENMCSPGNGDKGEKELHSLNADRVTQGLSTVWSLILLRPPIRDTCLQIALQVFFSYFCYTNFDVCLVVVSHNSSLVFFLHMYKLNIKWMA